MYDTKIIVVTHISCVPKTLKILQLQINKLWKDAICRIKTRFTHGTKLIYLFFIEHDYAMEIAEFIVQIYIFIFQMQN